MAGNPAIVILSLISFVTPLFAAIFTLLPIFKCPDIPAWPPIIQFDPIKVLPAMPTWAAIIEFLDILTPWAIWIKLSNLTLSSIVVESIDALSIVQFDPIFTLFPIITFPTCWIDIFSSAVKPKPLPPMIVPDSIIQFFPIIELDITQLFPIKVF